MTLMVTNTVDIGLLCCVLTTQQFVRITVLVYLFYVKKMNILTKLGKHGEPRGEKQILALIVADY